MKNKLKLLAEAHFFGIKTLSKKGLMALSKTKYGKLFTLNEKKRWVSSFSSLVESIDQSINGGEGVDDRPEFKPKMYKKLRMSPVCPDKRSVQELVNDVESKFNIGIENDDVTKFESVDCEELKRYIREFSNMNIFDQETKNLIDKILEAKSSCDVLLGLYSIN